MDSDQGKLFIGGISWETTEDKLKDHFGQYGDVLQTAVMRDKTTGRPRGFGFVVFAEPSVLDRVLQDQHTIDGRTVEAKRALSREEQQTNVKTGNSNSARSTGGGGGGGGGYVRTKKIFVGGLPPSLTEDGFRQYFEAYGHVTDVVIMYDQNTQRPRGFGFISFDSEDSVDRVLHKTFHDLNGKQVEVKRALPKDANPGGGSRSSMGGNAGGGGYPSYGSSGGSAVGSYDGRMDPIRYVQPQAAGGGYPPYGSSGYSGPGYGYSAAASNGVGYGGYGAYGGAIAGYGAPAGTYGNPNVANAGYGSGPPGAPRSSWNNQATPGYGAMGYGASAASWGASSGAASGGPGSTPTGQTPTGPGGYNQAYGYGSYGANDGSYGNPAGYGAVGGRSGGTPNSTPGELQGNGGGGYAGGAYGDANGNAGYANAAWNSESSQGSGNYGSQANGGAHSSQVAYGGGGYGSAPARQAQQH